MGVVTDLITGPNYLDPDVLQQIMKSTHFQGGEIVCAHKLFIKDSPDGKISRHQFHETYKTIFPNGNTKLFADNIFRVFDEDHDDFIEFREFLAAMSIIGRGSMEEKIDWMFKIYDQNENGSIERKELEQAIAGLYKMYGSEMVKHGFQEMNPKELAESVFKQMDSNADGGVTLEEFRTAVKSNGKIRQILDIDPHANV